MKLTKYLFAAVIGISTALCADFVTGTAAYEKGDYATALKEWEPLAKAGGSAAQFNLGLLYYDGKGVPQDFAEAARWFLKSADHGYVSAERNLGNMYAVGKGVKLDYVQAYKWLSLCASTGEEKCAAQRDLVADKMKSPKKLAEAQRLAREWKPIPGPKDQ